MSRRAGFVSILFMLLAFIQLAIIRPIFASEAQAGRVLTPDTQKAALNPSAINSGQIYFLVKQNPSQLKSGDLVFQSTNSTFYINASVEDLGKPNAAHRLLMAKVTKKGPIKVVTLANVGYAGIRTIQNPSGSTEYYLLTQKGKLDKVVKISYKPVLPRPKEDMMKKKAVISEKDAE